MGQEIVHLFDDMYQEAYYAWDSFFPEAERDLRFYLGDQWDEMERRQLFEQGRNAFVFNKIRRTINLVTGYQIKNRLSSVVLPVEDDDKVVSDQITRLLMHVFTKGDFYEQISNGFAGALKTGWNMMSLWKDYRDDPIDGDIKLIREPYNAFITDPYFTNLDLSDCGYIIRRKYLSKEQTKSLLPRHAKEIDSLHQIGWDRDDKFTWMPYQRMPNGQDMLAYNEMYQQKWKRVKIIIDPDTGDWTDWKGTPNELNQFLLTYPYLVVSSREKRYIELNVIVNDVHMDTQINPFGLDEYPMSPMAAIFEPESDLWSLKVQSLTRCMIDPQREGNRRRSQMTDLLDSQINSGYYADEDSVVNPSSLFQTSAGRVIWRKADARPGAVEKIQPGQIPPSMFQLQELFDRDQMEIAGVNDAAFGQTEMAGDSGVMMMLRQGASIINLQDLFDKLRGTQKQLTRKVVKMMSAWSARKFKRILNEEPDPKLFELDIGKYDISVQEGMLTDTQRQMYFRQLVDLKNLGVPVTGEALAEAAPIQGEKKWLQQLQQQEQAAAQQAQAQAQAQQQLQEMQSKLVQAQAERDLALAQEHKIKAIAAISDIQEKQSQSEENRANALLDRVKAIKELDEMDDVKLERYVSLITTLESFFREKEKQDEIRNEGLVKGVLDEGRDGPSVEANQGGALQVQGYGP